MHREHRQPETSLSDGRFEASDVSPKTMLRWGIALLVFMVASMATVLVYYAVLGGPLTGRAPKNVAEKRLAPWPRLQANPVKDLADFEREQARQASGYAWVDPTRGLVRIPVDRAIEIVVERGLPDWPVRPGMEGAIR
jgi:hypothetical protein